MKRGSLFRKKSIELINEELENKEIDNPYHALNRVLSVKDLTALGIAAIVGAGIFSTVGKATFEGGPAVIFLFIITAVTCGFSALCYAEFASRIPVSGSAYTYSYASFGELFAWIIGWDLIMEYAIGNIVVAISWSANLNSLLHNVGLHLPGFLTRGFMAAYKGNSVYLDAIAHHQVPTESATTLHNLWLSAPHIGSLPIIMDIPALLITFLITWVVYVGIRESRTSSNLMVAFKLLVIILIIIIGFFYVKPSNWIPFMPNGMGGVLKGVSDVFFAYIGFDAISTTAEECKNPQRDLPRGMIYSLIITTVLYILIALVLTGMVSYTKLDVGDFLARAFNERGLTWLGGAIALSALVATTSVLLVFQLGQPRIWMSMSRDGLLPKKFAEVHPKYHTPSFSTIVTGLLVGIPALFLDSDFVTDLTSIGTLFAFVLVSGGILLLPRAKKKPGSFTIPFINGKYIIPGLIILTAVLLSYFNPGWAGRLFSLHDASYPDFTPFEVFIEKMPYYAFVILMIDIGIYSYLRSWSVIPVIGLLSSAYLLTELGATNWIRFIVWLIIGLAIYFSYGIKNSRLRDVEESGAPG